MSNRPYKEARIWSDVYEPSMNQIACGLILKNNLINVTFIPPTYHEDAVAGVDQYIDIERLKVAYRVRKWEHLDYWKYGFTLRTSSKYGNPSELDKVMATKGDGPDYMLYSVADPDEPGEISSSVLIDLKSVGCQLVERPEILRQAKRSEFFVDLPYAAFPDPIIVGMR